MNDKTASTPRPTIEDLGFPEYLAYDATAAGAIYLGLDRNLFDPAEMIAALPAATEDADRGNWWEGMKLGREWLIERGVMGAYDADREDRFTRLVTCPSWCERAGHREDRGDLLDAVTHRRTIGRQGRGEVVIQSDQSYDRGAGPMDRPVLFLHDVEDGIEDPEEVRFLGAVLPAAAEALEAALAEWDRDNVTAGA